MLMDLNHTLVCPYCFQQSRVADCPVVSSITVPIPAATQQAMKRGNKVLYVWRQVLQRVGLSSRASPRTQTLITRQCPQCGGLLPHRLDELDAEFIGIVGGSLSGKSHYIASLIRQIEQERALDSFGCIDCHPLVPKLEQDYVQKYHACLYQRREVIAPAPTNTGFVEPLVYALVFQRRHLSPRVKQVNLILLDAPGDDLLGPQGKNEQLTRYVANAAGLIFLVDPFTLPALAEWLPAHLRQGKVGPEGFRILDAIAHIGRQYHGMREGQPLPLPLAITVAKSDLLRYVARNPATRPAFLSRPNYADGYRALQLPQVGEEIKEVLQRHEGGAFLTKGALFRQTGYFAVSATGCAPDYGQNPPKFRFVQPMRCVDPLIWLLIQLKAIEVAESQIK